MIVPATTISGAARGRDDLVIFETTDLYLGCYLKSRGLRLLRARRDGRRAIFEFQDDAIRQQLVEEFYNDGVVRVNDFKNAMQDLKGIIYNT